MDPLLPTSLNQDPNDTDIHGFPLPLVGTPPFHKQRSKCRKKRVLILTITTLCVLGLGGVLWSIFVGPIIHQADVTMTQAGPIMDQASEVMAKSDILFNLLWKVGCNSTTPLLPPEDCSALKPT